MIDASIAVLAAAAQLRGFKDIVFEPNVGVPVDAPSALCADQTCNVVVYPAVATRCRSHRSWIPDAKLTVPTSIDAALLGTPRPGPVTYEAPRCRECGSPDHAACLLVCGMGVCSFKSPTPQAILDHHQIAHGIPLPLSPPPDPVKPRHYKDLSPEPIDVIAAWRLNFNLGNAVKYIARADLKGTPITDLRKAAAYLAHEIALREKAHDGKPGDP